MNAYSIRELYEFAPEVMLTTASRANPLIEQGALNEAEFIDMRLSPQRSRAGVIFDIRWSGFEDSNTALVVVTGVGKVAWSNDASRQYPWYSTRGYWTPTTSNSPPLIAPNGGDIWARDADRPGTVADPRAMPAIEKLTEYVLNFDWLSLSGLTARIYIGHVDGLGGAPPDMTEFSDAEIIAGFPQWESVMEVREQYTYSP
ncbi:hypothetical protein LAUMK4_03009 [Mycobacterium persicum]|uniref:Uncharacterized protein n=2 Tax=Mycobacterium persicum TaxID=1487726 RepID=A0ABY6RJR6_9MYCO|nr:MULTISPECIES: hypothetical protein [Mycobacterium]VAZ61079.1 hypothetical protein LAUMK22_02888 [Mycobacterium kansasii]VAZ76506.1 hypothetical protein LAUMK15_03335 [Mycobacterium persicum]VAZ95037.1 hypothetical protein LAUMK4_03009 [Mycobacterium persicum]